MKKPKTLSWNKLFPPLPRFCYRCGNKKTDKKLQKKRAPFTISVFFLNKVFDYISLSLILQLDNVKNLFPDKLNIDEPPYDVYSLGKTIRNKILNCK